MQKSDKEFRLLYKTDRRTFLLEEKTTFRFPESRLFLLKISTRH